MDIARVVERRRTKLESMHVPKPKFKRETITVLVQYEIQYESEHKGARKEIVDKCVSELPCDLRSLHTTFGVSSAKRLSTKLYE